MASVQPEELSDFYGFKNVTDDTDLPKINVDEEVPHELTYSNNSEKVSNSSEFDYDEDFPRYIDEKITGPMVYVEKVHNAISNFSSKNKRQINILTWIIIIGLYHAWLVAAMIHNFNRSTTMMYLTIFAWVLAIYFGIIKRYFKKILHENLVQPITHVYDRLWSILVVRISFYLLIPSLVIAFLIFDTRNDRKRLSGLGGMAFFFVAMFLMSVNPARINWSPVAWGFFLQFVLGLAVLRWDWGRDKFRQVADNIVTFLDYTYSGTFFVYDFVSSPPPICGMSTPLAFGAFQVLIYFSALVSMLYYLNVMQVVFEKVAWFVQITLKTTAAESLYACVVIFIGMGEAPLLVKPYIPIMTPSELHAIMSSGLACVAGDVFIAYISEESDILEAINNGCDVAVEMVKAIVACLIVFVALLAFLDSIIEFIGELIGYDGWSFQLVLEYIFFPLAYIMGVNEDLVETLNVAKLMGTKTALNEFVAYQHLSQMLSSSPPKLSPRGAMIATYALCSFSNIGSIAIMVGIFGSLAPKRKWFFAKIAVRCLITGSISSFMTASLAGVLVENPTLCLPSSSSSDCYDVTKMQQQLYNETWFNSTTKCTEFSNFTVHTEL